jgi:hypothetical protein
MLWFEYSSMNIHQRTIKIDKIHALLLERLNICEA